jgi:hypothetical protein
LLVSGRKVSVERCKASFVKKNSSKVNKFDLSSRAEIPIFHAVQTPLAIAFTLIQKEKI